MTRTFGSVLLAIAIAIALSASAATAGKQAKSRSHRDVVTSVANMVSDQRAQELASARGLNVLNVMWEDTGRWQGSSVGPNISDVTIEVETELANGKFERHLMPVIRYPNFTDKTSDIKLDQFFVRVGNEKEGRKLRTVSLRQLLAKPGKYMSLPSNGKIKGGTLLAERDSHALVSAQHAFLPIRSGGKTKFWPVIFNYQSYDKNPAVLTILVTRQGASMTIIDNTRDTVGAAGSWGQRLYFNKSGQRAPLTAERLQDVKSKGVTMNGESAASLGDDANLLMMIQVPLVVKQRAGGNGPWMAEGGYLDDEMGAAAGSGALAPMTKRSAAPDLDTAVLGHGPTEGPYTELDALTIERDERFPVRVTVQFYQATSNGVLDKAAMAKMVGQIDKVYAKGDYIGSLVTPSPADINRPTNWDGVGPAPAHVSWTDFDGLVERYENYGTAGFSWAWKRFVAW